MGALVLLRNDIRYDVGAKTNENSLKFHVCLRASKIQWRLYQLLEYDSRVMVESKGAFTEHAKLLQGVYIPHVIIYMAKTSTKSTIHANVSVKLINAGHTVMCQILEILEEWESTFLEDTNIV